MGGKQKFVAVQQELREKLVKILISRGMILLRLDIPCFMNHAGLAFVVLHI